MNQCLKLTLTEEDVRKTIRFKVRNPILYVLQRTTGTLWRMYDDGVLVEVMAPFRAYRLSPEAAAHCKAFEKNGTIEPFVCKLEQHDHTVMMESGLASPRRSCPRTRREAARADGGW